MVGYLFYLLNVFASPGRDPCGEHVFQYHNLGKTLHFFRDLVNYPTNFDDFWHVASTSECKNFFLVTFCPQMGLKVQGHALKSRGFGFLTVFGVFCNHLLLKKFLLVEKFQVRKFISYKKYLLTPPSNLPLTRVFSEIHCGVNKF